MTNLRAAAWQILDRCEAAGQYSNLALDAAIRRGDFSSADRGLLTAIVYGTLERRLTLDHWIGALAARGEDSIEPSTRNLLRMGLYQLAYLDRVPDHAAVNETVALAPKKTRGFVNAILRAFLRAGKQIAAPRAETDPIAYLSVTYSFAPALCRVFCDTYGFSRTESLLAAFGKQPPLSLRVNTRRITREALCARLCADGYKARLTENSRSGILVEGSAPVTSLYGFAEGLFFVQDEASQLCVEALDAHEGMRVLDACACPGSKTFGIAIEMNDVGSITACDLQKSKLSLIASGAERLGLSIIQTEARDARDERAAWVGAFDRVLCDVPCSGFGVFAKKPELRYKDPTVSESLPAIQQAILARSFDLLREGGRLVYSTCTLLPRENGENVARFLATHPDCTLLWERTLFPDTDGTDGFYVAVLQKKTEKN